MEVGNNTAETELKEIFDAFKEGLQNTVKKIGDMSRENIKGISEIEQHNMSLIQKVLNDANKIKKLGHD